jgi:hypothetical protein
MAKTRLNEDKRHVLRTLAYKAVAATPIDPAIEKRVKKAWEAYDKLIESMAKEAVTLVKQQVSDADLKVLKKYGCVTTNHTLIFVDLDTRHVFEVSLFNEKRWRKDNPRSEHNFEEQQKWHKSLRKATANTEISIPSRHTCKTLKASKKLIKLNSTSRDVTNELEMARGADQNKRNGIMRDFDALIQGSRTFEDVVEYWPEAKEVTLQIVGSGTEVSLVSNQAKERILANMATRGVTA